jgi:hypothetical protein
MASIDSFRRTAALRPLALVTVAAFGLAGCATPATPPSTNPPSAAAAPAGAASAAAAAAAPASGASAASAARPPDPTAPKPFAEVIREATREDGYIPVWRKDEKVWLELSPERLGQPFMFSVNIASSVGERGLYASQMGPDWLAEFRKVGNQIQLMAKQTDFRGDRDPASARAVREAFSDSLLGSSVVASAPHPERKSVLVDASFLFNDIAGYGPRLEVAFRLPFAPDRANSYFESTRAEGGLTTLSTKIHFAVARLPAPPLVPPGASPPPSVAPPQTAPDPRSLFVGFVYNFRELPAQPMAPRRADPRVGHFIESFTDLSDDLKPNPRVHNIRRWRLEKKDPQAVLSEPVTPITYWLDRNIPARYRPAIEAGVLEWNKAFERIGFKNAIVVRQQPDDAGFDDMDAAHASIRWFVGADVGFAIGPSHADPRTGEILDADIGMSDVFGRGSRRSFREDVGASVPAWQAAQATWAVMGSRAGQMAACTYAADAADEMTFALDLLEARGDLDPDSPETEAFVQAYIKDVIVHEVGHTLGLRHNFKASTTVTREQLKDKAFGDTHGISGSVMDYNAFNLPLAGEPKGEYNMVGLGAYDYWAIEYAYKPLPAATEAAELQKIASRSATEPGLAFADDADAGFGDSGGIDPLVNRFDLGDDPLAWYQKRFALSKELWQRVQERGAQPGDDPERLRRSLLAGFRQLGALPALAAKYVGGMYTERDPQGSGGRPAFRPVEPARQRQALRFLTDSLFSTDSFRFKPEFLASLSPDYVEWNRAGPVGVPDTVLALQTQAMDRLLAAGTARRLLDLPNYLPEKERRNTISLNEVYATLQTAVWSELQSGREIEPLRRGLQRAHLTRLQALLTRPQPGLPADAVSLARLQALQLQGELQKALARKGLAVENRAHLQESLGLLTEALKATMQRS